MYSFNGAFDNSNLKSLVEHLSMDVGSCGAWCLVNGY